MIKVRNGSALKIAIATGKNRKESNWKNTEITWGDLVNRLSQTVKTNESISDYMSMPKDEQDRIKDVGGFVGGELKDGKRKNGYVKSRNLVTLDIDFATTELWDDIELLTDYAMAAYSTHKHTPKKPRLRLIIPLDRKVSPEEYEAIGRKIADDIGIDYFDDTTYEPTRLMFWPSTPKDVDYFFRLKDEPILSADKILEKYPDWKDTSYWPESSRARSNRKKTADKQGDPLSKDGLIGAFCRTYTIQDAIEKFIPESYEECDTPGRYTYVNGSTAAGLVIYEDKFAYSNHGTDPIGGQLCNAFDLVRIHKFKDLDEEAKENTPVNKLPSWTAIMGLIALDEEVKKFIIKEKINSAKSEFEAPDEDSDNWIKNLSLNKQGVIESTLNNIILIVENDPRLAKLGSLNLFSNRKEAASKLPWERGEKNGWNDADEAELRAYLEKIYHVEARQKIQDAIEITFKNNRYHPVRNYLNSLSWDGVPRVELILINYLGVEDSSYVREITKKFMVAAVKRIFEPGCKFDYMLTLVGNQGEGKSSIFQHLVSQEWFNTIETIEGKEGSEVLDGKWIIEMAEMKAVRRVERETIKSYISRQVDTYRKAYAKNVEDYPRQCVFVGTTNDREFLADNTGGRRFWVVDTNVNKAEKDMWKDFPERTTSVARNQLWAEAMYYYSFEEININLLSESSKKEAKLKQDDHSESGALLGMIEAFLQVPINVDWYKKSIVERQMWISANDEFRSEDEDAKNQIRRTRVSAVEVWCEMFRKDPSAMNDRDSRNIKECLDKIPGWERGSTMRAGSEYGIQKCHYLKNK